MAKENITQYDTTAANNTDIDSVNIAEGCPPSGINNAIRELMAHLADVNAGTVALGTIKVDNLQLDGNAITSKDTNGDVTKHQMAQVMLSLMVLNTHRQMAQQTFF